MNGRELIIRLNFGLNTFTFFSLYNDALFSVRLYHIDMDEGDTVIKCSSISTPLLNTSIVGAE